MIDTLPRAKKIYFNKENSIIDYGLIRKLHEEEDYDIDFMCKELGLSRASYYKWLKRKPGKRDIENEKLLKIIREVSSSNNSLFGSWTMTYYIRNQYDAVYNHKRVYRLMCINDIVSNYQRKPVYIYRSPSPETTAENILGRDFNSENINEKW